MLVILYRLAKNFPKLLLRRFAPFPEIRSLSSHSGLNPSGLPGRVSSPGTSRFNCLWNLTKFATSARRIMEAGMLFELAEPVANDHAFPIQYALRRVDAVLCATEILKDH
jgi:hypothetical protein